MGTVFAVMMVILALVIGYAFGHLANVGYACPEAELPYGGILEVVNAFVVSENPKIKEVCVYVLVRSFNADQDLKLYRMSEVPPKRFIVAGDRKYIEVKD